MPGIFRNISHREQVLIVRVSPFWMVSRLNGAPDHGSGDCFRDPASQTVQRIVQILPVGGPGRSFIFRVPALPIQHSKNRCAGIRCGKRFPSARFEKRAVQRLPDILTENPAETGHFFVDVSEVVCVISYVVSVRFFPRTHPFPVFFFFLKKPIECVVFLCAHFYSSF